MADYRQGECVTCQSQLPGCPVLGRVRWRRAWKQDVHRHPGLHEVHVFPRSAQRFRIDEHIVDVPANHALVIAAGRAHGPLSGAVNAGECLWLQLRLDPRSFCTELPDTDRRHVIADIKRCARAGVLPLTDAGIAAFRSLVACHDRSGVHQRHLAHAALIEAITHLCMALAPVEQEVGPGLSEPIAAAVMRMRCEVGQEVPLPDLAAAAGLSQRAFHQRFVRETGFTPGNFRTRCRIDWAQEVLRESRASITNIALEAGFPSSQYFATVFRRYVGCSPHEFRQRG